MLPVDDRATGRVDATGLRRSGIGQRCVLVADEDPVVIDFLRGGGVDRALGCVCVVALEDDVPVGRENGDVCHPGDCSPGGGRLPAACPEDAARTSRSALPQLLLALTQLTGRGVGRMKLSATSGYLRALRRVVHEVAVVADHVNDLSELVAATRACGELAFTQ